MVKRLSVMFNTLLRAELATDSEIGSSKGMSEVLRLINVLLTRIASPIRHADSFESCVVDDRLPHILKVLTVGYEENNWLDAAIRLSARVEVVVGRWVGETLVVDVFCYMKGEKEDCLHFYATFRLSDGALTSHGEGVRGSLG